MTVHDAVKQIQAFLDQAGIGKTAGLIVGVSGGVDSMVLLHLLRKTSLAITVLHINYGLRGSDSDADQQLVEAYCEKHNIQLHVLRPNRDDFVQPGKSLQEGARDYRYHHFMSVASERQAQAVALGHHADDNAETILHNLFRGTGIEGLGGMPSVRPIRNDHTNILVVRPLLDISRATIESIAESEDVPWRSDESNLDASYERGFMRSTLRPILEEQYSQKVFENIASAGQKVASYLDSRHDRQLDRLFSTATVSNRKLLVSVLGSVDEVWRRRLILEALYRWFPEVDRSESIAARISSLTGLQTGRQVEYPGLNVVRERETIGFYRAEDVVDYHERLAAPGDSVTIPGGLLRLDLLPYQPARLATFGERIAFVADGSLPLEVRTWRAGDRMSLFGGGGTKKVSDVLTDKKVDTVRRSRIVVVCAADKIIWIPGVARSDAYKISANDSQVLMMTYIAET